MNNSKKRELYFILLLLSFSGECFFLIGVDFYFIEINFLLRIILCVIFFILSLIVNNLINKLGKEQLTGEEIDCNTKKVKLFIKNNYELVSSNENNYFSKFIYKGIMHPKKSALIVIKTNKIGYKVKQEIYDIIDWYKSTYLKKRIPFIGKNYELKIICFCDDYSINSVSYIFSKVYLTRSRGCYDGIAIPIFASTSKEKMYISGFKYIRKYDIDYYSLEKKKLVELINENTERRSLWKQ